MLGSLADSANIANKYKQLCVTFRQLADARIWTGASEVVRFCQP